MKKSSAKAWPLVMLNIFSTAHTRIDIHALYVNPNYVYPDGHMYVELQYCLCSKKLTFVPAAACLVSQSLKNDTRLP